MALMFARSCVISSGLDCNRFKASLAVVDSKAGSAAENVYAAAEIR